MNFEKLRWWLKSKAVIKKDEWYYPVLQLTITTKSYTIPGWRYPVTQPMQKYVIRYNKYFSSYQTNRDDFKRAIEKTQDTLTRCKNRGYVVITLTFDQFYSFWSINPYRWHCRDLFTYTEDEENKKMFVQFKTKTDLHIYIGWREEIREAYEKQALIEERSKSTIALLKEVQRDINDTNDKAIEYYEQAVEYLGDDDNE